LVRTQALLAFWLQTYYVVGGKLIKMLRRHVFCSAKAKVLHRIMKAANSYEEWKVPPRPGEKQPYVGRGGRRPSHAQHCGAVADVRHSPATWCCERNVTLPLVRSRVAWRAQEAAEELDEIQGGKRWKQRTPSTSYDWKRLQTKVGHFDDLLLNRATLLENNESLVQNDQGARTHTNSTQLTVHTCTSGTFARCESTVQAYFVAWRRTALHHGHESEYESRMCSVC
jgi:hypothetical protein